MRTLIKAAVMAIVAMLCASSPWHRIVVAAAPVDLARLPAGAIQPQIAVDSKGTIHVLYFKGEASHGDLFYARLDPSGTFSKPVQVNRTSGSAIATGTMRGGHLAIGKNGRVHVAWHGSDLAMPRSNGGETPVLYSRMDGSGAAFEPERNVVQHRVNGLDGGTVAADPFGNVYVAWHAFEPGTRGEADRRVWIARSQDEGRTFTEEIAASDASTGTCGCCAVAMHAARDGGLNVLYRAATDVVHRDTYLITSRDRGRTFDTEKLQAWNVGACPMSTASFAEIENSVLAAWETDGQVQWTAIAANGQHGAIVPASGASRNRKHPAIAVNTNGDVLLVWTEGTGWNKGGGLAWELFRRNGQITGQTGQAPGVSTWSLAAVAAQPNGRFVVLY